MERQHLTIYRYDGWSIQPCGVEYTLAAAQDACYAELACGADAIRAIDDNGDCVVSIERDDDGPVSPLAGRNAKERNAQ